jgi:hypothetical protein
MSIFRINSKLYYFSHIPKCGGSSVEDYVKNVTGKRGSFIDRGYYKNKIKVFKNSSPQHILGVEVANLFEPDFFDGYFAVVRCPYERFKSAFIFQKYIEKNIPNELSMNQFLIGLKESADELWGKYDNHFVAQSYFLYPGVQYEIFKLENGLNGVKRYIDKINHFQSDSTSMPHKLQQSAKIKSDVGEIDQQARKIIYELYRIDFDNFNYYHGEIGQ